MATEYWTTVLDTRPQDSRRDAIERMRRDFEPVPRFETHQVERLEKIGEGGQGEIYKARVYIRNSHLQEMEQLPVDCVVKEFKHGAYGQWPETIFELSKLFPANICGFLGYHINEDTETFYLIMHQYDRSLRDVIDKQITTWKVKLQFCVAFAVLYFSFLFLTYRFFISGDVLKLVVKQSFGLLGGIGVMRMVVVAFLRYHKSRPLADGRALFMMVQIALGMWILHENPTWRGGREEKRPQLVHRDLKADNVFVRCEKSGRFPIAAYIGDFDVGSKVVGTKFWRAPEILQALRDNEVQSRHCMAGKIMFESPADVYSYGMTCYEILTGGIPLEGEMASDYDVVLGLLGKRPELPSDLHPRVAALIKRCWHMNPAERPTFAEIVIELEELVKVVATGSQDLSKTFSTMFERARTTLEVVSGDAETNLVRLKQLLQVLVVKYNQADFLHLGLEVVAAMEEFSSVFGFDSFQKRPGLPYPKWFARRKLFDTLLWKRSTFARTSAYIDELNKLSALMESIMDTIMKDNCHEDSYSNDGKDAAEIAERDREWQAHLQEVKERMRTTPRTLIHKRCVDKLNGISTTTSPADIAFQPCDLCKFQRSTADEGNAKYRLFVNHDNDSSPFTKLAALFCVKIRLWLGRWNQ